MILLRDRVCYLNLVSDLEKTGLERKIRLLTLASLGFQNVGRDLPYSTIAINLQIESSDVETWAIDGKSPQLLVQSLYSLGMFHTIVIRAGLLSGKLSQTTQTLHVTRSAARTFKREQWEALEKRLVAWKTGLTNVLEVVATAKKRNETPQAGTPQIAGRW